MEEYKQKQRIGIERAKAEGKYTGRAPLIEDKIFLIKKLLKDGQTKAEIARQLNISRKTIYNYLDRL
jgi:DNA invertase Pin-like site-specific DNA recombinase